MFLLNIKNHYVKIHSMEKPVESKPQTKENIMDVNQAIDLVEKATSLLNGTRQDHVNIQEAIRIIKEAVEPKKAKK